MRAAANEVGEAIGPLLREQANVGGRFEGYTDEEATEKKILRDVFSPGDRWFNSGDFVLNQGHGHMRFIDRLGDGRALVVGDRLDTDLQGAAAAGLDAAIVLTGAAERGEAEAAKDPAPVAVADTLASLVLDGTAT